jgi:hypothetical protein
MTHPTQIIDAEKLEKIRARHLKDSTLRDIDHATAEWRTHCDRRELLTYIDRLSPPTTAGDEAMARQALPCTCGMNPKERLEHHNDCPAYYRDIAVALLSSAMAPVSGEDAVTATDLFERMSCVADDAACIEMIAAEFAQVRASASEAAKKAERERCAAIAEHRVGADYSGMAVPRFRDGQHVAAAIRSTPANPVSAEGE